MDYGFRQISRMVLTRSSLFHEDARAIVRAVIESCSVIRLIRSIRGQKNDCETADEFQFKRLEPLGINWTKKQIFGTLIDANKNTNDGMQTTKIDRLNVR